MVVTRSQPENLSKDELIDRLLQIVNIEDKPEHLNKRFDDFLGKYDELHSELQVSSNCSNLLRNQVVEHEKNALNRAQYVRREIIEISPVPGSISVQNLERQVCKALSLTGIKVENKDLHACHRMKRRGRVILKFKDRKLRYQVMANRKKLLEKKNELKELHFEESLYLSDSIYTENHNLFYKCRQLKNAKRVHSCWFFNNVINARLMDKDPIFKIFHESDMGELLRANVELLKLNVVYSFC